MHINEPRGCCSTLLRLSHNVLSCLQTEHLCWLCLHFDRSAVRRCLCGCRAQRTPTSTAHSTWPVFWVRTRSTAFTPSAADSTFAPSGTGTVTRSAFSILASCSSGLDRLQYAAHAGMELWQLRPAPAQHSTDSRDLGNSHASDGTEPAPGVEQGAFDGSLDPGYASGERLDSWTAILVRQKALGSSQSAADALYQ